MPALTAAGVQLYALSYDEQEPLRDFAAAHDITYRFLSDPNSEVIRAFGILNTIIPEADHPWFGIPYPGTYVMDAAGLITHKFFENNLAVRVGPGQLVRAAQGLSVELAEVDQSPAVASEVEVEVLIAGDELALSVQSELLVLFNVPVGKHLYAEPAPQGSVAVDIELDPVPGLVTRAVQRPLSEPHSLADTDETFPVHKGKVELRLPLTVNGDAFSKGGQGEVRLSGRVHWQSCDDTLCDIPVAYPFELRVPLAKMVPSFMMAAKTLETEPRGQEHFQQMIARRQKAT